MVDFEQIGGIYNDRRPAVKQSNVNALNGYLADISKEAFAIRFDGPLVKKRREPAVAYFNSTIELPDDKPVIIDGGSSRLVWEDIVDSVPAIFMTRASASGGLRQQLRDLNLESSGSGIVIDNAGNGTHLSDIRITCAGVGTLDYDGWSDMHDTEDAPGTAAFGVKIQNGADSLNLTRVSCYACGGHGFLVCDHLHGGRLDIRAHGCGGSGFKAERIVTTEMLLESESNYAWGVHLRRCGGSTWDKGERIRNTDSSAVMCLHCEANNRRGSPFSLLGHSLRQTKIESSACLTISGHWGWNSNKTAIDGGSRRSCRLIQSLHTDWSVTPIWDLNSDAEPQFTLPDATSSALNNNWDSKWSTHPTNKPVLSVTGNPTPAGGEPDQGFRIDIPIHCFDTTDGTAYFYVPADRNIFFQVLNQEYQELQRERTYVNYRPGEFRSCVGCHETPHETADMALSSGLAALRRPPSLPGPQPGEVSGQRCLDYEADVQPILDRHCVACHDGANDETDLDLRGVRTDLFSVSYENLIGVKCTGASTDWYQVKRRDLLGTLIYENNPKVGNAEYLPPRSLGSTTSRLWHILRAGHHDVHLSQPEMVRLTTWIDSNAQYYGSYWGRKTLKHQHHPNFRPKVTFEQAISRRCPVQESDR